MTSKLHQIQKHLTEAVDDIDALLDAQTATEAVPETDDTETSLDSETTIETADDIDALLDQQASSGSVNEIDDLLDQQTSSETGDDIDDLSEFENIDLSTLKSVDQTISELDAESEALENDSSVSEDKPSDFGSIEESDSSVNNEQNQNSLAEQLSNGAFNEDVALPSIDENDDDGYIDIDTLLTSNGGEELSEEDFNLEFGLEEFPDVVESFTEFDSDDDGVAAQLDLARAYLEIDEKDGAKSILTKLLESAQDDKLKEVKKLLDRIS